MYAPSSYVSVDVTLDLNELSVGRRNSSGSTEIENDGLDAEKRGSSVDDPCSLLHELERRCRIARRERHITELCFEIVCV